ncbi:MAG: tetratricopeptide repeat protein [Candidatus Sericytochromatia bacterium]
MGSYYFQLKKFDNAVLEYSEAIKIFENNTIYYERGECYYNLKNYDSAIADYKKSIDLSQKNNISYYKLALTYLLKDDLPKSLETINTAFAYYEIKSSLYFLRAMINNQLKEYTQALKDIDKFIVGMPLFMPEIDSKKHGYSLKSTILINLGEYDKAKETIDFSLKINKYSSWNYSNLAYYYVKQRNFEEALKNYYKALELEKGDKSDIYYNIACTYSEHENTPKALEYLKKAIEIKNNFKVMATTDDSFNNLRENLDFTELIK